MNRIPNQTGAMSEIRYDVTTEEWVVFAQETGRRTNPIRRRAAFKGKTGSKRKTCPYCPGNEHQTPAEIQAVRDESAADPSEWRIRLIAHQQPIFQDEVENRASQVSEPFRALPGGGRHEVIIESPDHESYLGHQPEDQIHSLLQVMHERFRAHTAEKQYKSILLFKNHGTAAGATLHHPHFQLIAFPIVPLDLQRKQAIATRYYRRHGRYLYEDLLQAELENRQRLWFDNEAYVVLLPYASHRPFETWILPRKQQPSFTDAKRADLVHLAKALKTILSTVYTGLENPDFSLSIHSASCDDLGANDFRWHIELCPYLTRPNGIELASGLAVNTVFPEEAAAFLRGVVGNGG